MAIISQFDFQHRRLGQNNGWYTLHPDKSPASSLNNAVVVQVHGAKLLKYSEISQPFFVFLCIFVASILQYIASTWLYQGIMISSKTGDNYYWSGIPINSINLFGDVTCSMIPPSPLRSGCRSYPEIAGVVKLVVQKRKHNTSQRKNISKQSSEIHPALFLELLDFLVTKMCKKSHDIQFLQQSRSPNIGSGCLALAKGLQFCKLHLRPMTTRPSCEHFWLRTLPE